MPGNRSRRLPQDRVRASRSGERPPASSLAHYPQLIPDDVGYQDRPRAIEEPCKKDPRQRTPRHDQGVNVDATVAMARASTIPVIASGGITNMDDILALAAVAGEGICGAITGRAIYEGTLDLTAAQSFCDEAAG